MSVCHVEGCEYPIASPMFRACAGHILPDAADRSCPHAPRLYASQTDAAHPRRHRGCELNPRIYPDCTLPGTDCKWCERYQCSRCERLIAWEHGCADSMTKLCADCWEVMRNGWHDDDPTISMVEVYAESEAWEPTPGSLECEPNLEVVLSTKLVGKVIRMAFSGHTIGPIYWRNPTRRLGGRKLEGMRFVVTDITIGGRRQLTRLEEKHGGKLSFAPHYIAEATERAGPGDDWEFDNIAGGEIRVVVVAAEPECRYRLQVWIKHE